jgi:Oxidoreductase molybdopterin binding domain
MIFWKHNTGIIIAILFAAIFGSCSLKKQNENSKNTASSVGSAANGTQSCTTKIIAADSSQYNNKVLDVTGAVVTPLHLTVDSLKKMDVKTIANFKVVCQTGTTVKVDTVCKGVLLRDILEKAELQQIDHKDRSFYFVARATDNFKAIFSWGEVFNNATGDNIYILFEENGQPIRSQGDMILVCTTDIKTGPRHVFWLKSIEVYKVK